MATPQAVTEPGGSNGVQLRPYGQYLLVRKLAEGGMAEIFLAKRVGSDGVERNVVIKRMLAHLSGQPDFVQMFRDEARLAVKLAHPNVVQVHELGFAEGCHFMCMEYLAGEDFSTTVRTASFRGEYVPVPLVLRVLADAARGLHHAHELTDELGQRMNIVHRDISPANLYVTYEGRVKVLDFGIAKAESRLSNTRTGVVKGKYIYMAPEQAQGSSAVDRRADIFSLGVSLYEALTHVRPFARDNDLAVLNALLAGKFEPPRALRPELSPELEAVVLRAMASEPAQRHATAAEFADDLERILSYEPQPTTGAHLAAYLRSSFGEARYVEKTRIPALATLGQAALVPPATATSSTRPGARSSIVPTPSGAGIPTVQPPRRGGLIAGVVACCLVLAGGAFVMGRNLGTAPSEPEMQPASLLVAQAAPPSDSAPPPKSAVSPSKSPGAASPGGSRTPTSSAKTAEAEPSPQADNSRTSKLMSLETVDIQRVVSRNRARIMSCFEQNKHDLPATEGDVQVRFTIYASGKADATTQGPLAKRPVGKCLEKQVERMRFPAHRDKEVTVVLPFGYRVSR